MVINAISLYMGVLGVKIIPREGVDNLAKMKGLLAGYSL